MAIRQGHQPVIPAELLADGGATAAGAGIDDAAWTFLGAQAAIQKGAAQDCWRSCRQLGTRGLATEQLMRLQTNAAIMAEADAEDDRSAVADWWPDPVVPDSCLPAAVHYAVKRGQTEQATTLVNAHRQVHPESLWGFWLDAAFWLDPIRNWIA